MMRACHHMPYGATLMPQGGAVFRLWAPAQVDMDLMIYDAEGQSRPYPVEPDALGWREVIVPDAARRPATTGGCTVPRALFWCPIPHLGATPTGFGGPAR